jgi:hypothetical protein
VRWAHAPAWEASLAFCLVEQKGTISGQHPEGGNEELERAQPNSKALRKSVSQTELLLEGARKLQQLRVIAMALRDTMLIHLIDMAILQVDESFDRHLRFVNQVSDSAELN